MKMVEISLSEEDMLNVGAGVNRYLHGLEGHLNDCTHMMDVRLHFEDIPTQGLAEFDKLRSEVRLLERVLDEVGTAVANNGTITEREFLIINRVARQKGATNEQS